jgi:uncharacterized protein (DUF952 family)
VIYHLVIQSEFAVQVCDGLYRPADLPQVGFVHCASEDSVILVADDYYAEASGPVLLLEIDSDKLNSETRYEAAAPIAGGGSSHLENASVFPHVYGPIETLAITRVGVLSKTADGFGWPEEFVEVASLLGGS